jgi:hypothetical protein
MLAAISIILWLILGLDGLIPVWSLAFINVGIPFCCHVNLFCSCFDSVRLGGQGWGVVNLVIRFVGCGLTTVR